MKKQKKKLTKKQILKQAKRNNLDSISYFYYCNVKLIKINCDKPTYSFKYYYQCPKCKVIVAPAWKAKKGWLNGS